MKPKTIKNIGSILIAAGAIPLVLGISTDDAREQALPRKDVANPEPRVIYKEDCASQETTNKMVSYGAIPIIIGLGLVITGKQKGA